MTPLKTLTCACIVLGAMMAGCIKDAPEIRDLSYNATPEWGIPLAFASISAARTIEHFDSEGFVTPGSDGLVRLVYVDTLPPIGIADFLQLPDQSFAASFQLSDQQFGVLVSEGSYVYSDTRLFEFETGAGDRIDSIRFADGQFRLLVQSDGGVPLSGHVALLHPSTDAELYRIDFDDATQPVYIDVDASLHNALLQFLNDASTQNGLKVAYGLNFTYGGSGINAEVSIDFDVSGMAIRNIGGYLVPRTIPLYDEGLRISMFDNVPAGTQIRIEDPRINFYIDNGFGLGALLGIDGLFATNPEGQTVAVQGSAIAPLPVIGAAPSPGQSRVTKLTIDNALMTPSVTEVLAIHPNYLTGDFNLTVNPLNAQSVFITSEALLGLSYEAEIPVFGSLANFALTDTADINLGDVITEVENNAEVSQLDIRILVDNGLPVDAALQIVFADELYRPIDSLFAGTTDIFVSAPLMLGLPPNHPNYGRAAGTTRTVIDIPVSRERVLNMQEVSRIIFRVSGHTTANGDHPIRLFETDHFDVRLGAKIKLDLND